MLQGEDLLNSRVISIKDNIVRKNDSIKRLEKCIEVGKQEGITESNLIPWGKRIMELKADKKRLEGELHNIYNTCEHVFEKIGTRQTLFGEEYIYQCNKCGYQTIMD